MIMAIEGPIFSQRSFPYIIPALLLKTPARLEIRA